MRSRGWRSAGRAERPKRNCLHDFCSATADPLCRWSRARRAPTSLPGSLLLRTAEPSACVHRNHEGYSAGFKLQIDRKSVVLGKSVSVRVDLGGSRHIKKKKKNNKV